jgi:uncharacterized damage-inducible protein DinB
MPTSAESKKTQVIEALAGVREKILSAAAALPLEKQEQVFLGVWAVRDLLAHLAGWDYANLEAAQAVLAERLPAFYAHHGRDWSSYNAFLVEKYHRADLAEQLLLVRKSHQELISHLAAISASDFAKDTGVRFHGWRVTIEHLLQSEISDEEKHLAQIEAWAAAPLLPYPLPKKEHLLE